MPLLWLLLLPPSLFCLLGMFVGISSPGEAFRPSAVERAAAAQVLAGERSRFKRVVSKRLGQAGVSPDGGGGRRKKRARGGGKGGGAEGEVLAADVGDGGVGARGGGGRGGTVDAQGRDERKQEDEDEEELRQPVLISVGGFKAVDQSVAVTREVADFCRVVGEVKRAAAAAAAGVAAGYGDAAAAEEGGAGSALARAGLFEPAFLLILHSLEVRESKDETTCGDAQVGVCAWSCLSRWGRCVG